MRSRSATAPRAAGAILGALFFAALLLFFARHRAPSHLAIGGGSLGGTTLPLAERLAKSLREQDARLDAKAAPTAGGVENGELVARGRVELALVPNNAPSSPELRTIAPLYDEALHLVVRRDVALEGLGDLRGRRVAVGPRGSGTERLVTAVLAHLGVALDELRVVHLTHDEAASAFERGEVDAVFALTGVPAPAVGRLLARPDARLVSLGDAAAPGSKVAGLRVALPYLSAVTIPALAYGEGQPDAAGTVGVRLLLVASRDLDADVAMRVTKALFDDKASLVEEQPCVAALSERFEPSDLHFPLHPGAASYYRRDDPPFILAWADTFSLGVTLVVLGWSALATLRAKRRRARKERVDKYYAEVQAVAGEVDPADDAEALRARRRRLQELRRQAFRELMSERLEADESFTIFQDYLRAELLEIDRALRELDVEAPSSSLVVSVGAGRS